MLRESGFDLATGEGGPGACISFEPALEREKPGGSPHQQRSLREVHHHPVTRNTAQLGNELGPSLTVRKQPHTDSGIERSVCKRKLPVHCQRQTRTHPQRSAPEFAVNRMRHSQSRWFDTPQHAGDRQAAHALRPHPKLCPGRHPSNRAGPHAPGHPASIARRIRGTGSHTPLKRSLYPPSRGKVPLLSVALYPWPSR